MDKQQKKELNKRIIDLQYEISIMEKQVRINKVIVYKMRSELQRIDIKEWLESIKR